MRSLEIIVTLSLLGTKSAREGSISVESVRGNATITYYIALLCAIMRKSDYDLDLGRTKEEKKNKNLRSSNRPFAEMEYYLV